MASNLPLNAKFTWGDFVKIKESSPIIYKPGSLGSICGIWNIESQVTMREFNVPFGTFMYTVEFEDGHTLEIPENHLEFISKCKSNF